MKTILEQYFIEFGQLDLLSFGCLKLQNKEAQYVEDGLDAPKETIQFESIASTPSKHFYIFLADALSISIEQAAIQYEQYIQHLFLENENTIEFESIGRITKINGFLNWQSYLNSNHYYSSLSFEKVSDSIILDEFTEDNKDNWGLYASIIAIGSLVAILFKFYH